MIAVTEYFEDLSLLDLAVLNNDSETIHKILSHTSKDFIDTQNSKGLTSVMLASKKEKCKDALLTLLEYNPNLTLKTNNNENVLSIAQKSSDVNFNILKSHIQKSVLGKRTQSSNSKAANTARNKRGLL